MVLLWMLPMLLSEPAHADLAVVELAVYLRNKSGSDVLVGLEEECPVLAREFVRALEVDPSLVVVLPTGEEPVQAMTRELSRAGLACGILVRRIDERAYGVKTVGSCVPLKDVGSDSWTSAPIPSPPQPEPEPEPVEPPQPPVTPTEPFLVAHLFHLRMGGEGISWNSGALVDFNVWERWSLSGGATVNLGTVVVVDADLGFRRHFKSFSRGGFLELGSGSSVLAGEYTRSGFSFSPHVLLGSRRTRYASPPNRVALAMDWSVGLRVDMGMNTYYHVAPGLVIRLDGGFSL